MSKPKPNTHSDVKDLLNERNNTHGEFTENARISQGIKRVMETSVNWNIMPDIHREALEYIAGKIGRILSGQYDYDDSWDDISGFAGLPKKFNHGK
jgi:hypothetical protein